MSSENEINEKLEEISRIREQIVNELLEEHPIEELVSFNELNIKEATENNQFYTLKYKDLYLREKFKYEKLEEVLDAAIGKRYDFYRFDYHRNLKKPEIEKYYLPKDKIILNIKKHLVKQKVRMEFFEACWKGFEKQQWNIKNWLDANRVGL